LNMDETIIVIYDTKEVEAKFMSLTEKQREEFATDIDQMVDFTIKAMDLCKTYTANHVCAQRLDNECFIVDLAVNFNNKDKKVVLIKKIDKVGMDEYLDRIIKINNDSSDYRK